ncbi:hypothetical protein [Pseudonocardia endophytica]|uniref:Uncharacterized protein n=1 Tax=Pseudonocardia endophytica TaxID=401976 RepID=A0A4R1HSM2_PSEEN|nr:hypothetical protein [Pseudonocardia endophytica]TCK20392.1 hypothetical protein EV378_4351 [Pseudonocardia endophytica]
MSDDVAGNWDRAVDLGGYGHYAAAESLLRALRTGPGVPGHLRAHAAVTRASHLRQVGSHGRAAVHDAAAVRVARPLAGDRAPEPGSDRAGTGVAAALGDALAGLAADAIGRWDAVGARRLLDRAAPWCGVPDDERPPVSRTAVRWLWVRAETALLAGDAGAAVVASGTACTLAPSLGSVRHAVKSRLVHAVARSVAGEAVDGELDAVADDAGAAGLLPLRWAALVAAGDTITGPRVDDIGPGPNGRHAGGWLPDTLGRRTVAQSRRHATMIAANVVYLRSDPVTRAGMRESAWLMPPGAVPY